MIPHRTRPVTTDNAAEQIDLLLMEAVDLLAVFPEVEIDPRRWEQLKIYGPENPPAKVLILGQGAGDD